MIFRECACRRGPYQLFEADPCFSAISFAAIVSRSSARVYISAFEFSGSFRVFILKSRLLRALLYETTGRFQFYFRGYWSLQIQ